MKFWSVPTNQTPSELTTSSAYSWGWARIHTRSSWRYCDDTATYSGLLKLVEPLALCRAPMAGIGLGTARTYFGE